MPKGIVPQFLISIKINKVMKEKGLAVGLPHTFVTKDELEAKNKRNEEAVGHKKAHRLQRADTTGTLATDAGNLIFGKNGQDNVSPTLAICDLIDLGFYVSDVEIYEKEGDNGNGFLRIQFSKEKERVRLTDEQHALVGRLTIRTYRKLYGYRNPASDTDPENETFNFSGPITEASEISEKYRSFRNLRLYEDGSARCVPVH